MRLAFRVVCFAGEPHCLHNTEEVGSLRSAACRFAEFSRTATDAASTTTFPTMQAEETSTCALSSRLPTQTKPLCSSPSPSRAYTYHPLPFPPSSPYTAARFDVLPCACASIIPGETGPEEEREGCFHHRGQGHLSRSRQPGGAAEPKRLQLLVNSVVVQARRYLFRTKSVAYASVSVLIGYVTLAAAAAAAAAVPAVVSRGLLACVRENGSQRRRSGALLTFAEITVVKVCNTAVLAFPGVVVE